MSSRGRCPGVIERVTVALLERRELPTLCVVYESHSECSSTVAHSMLLSFAAALRSVTSVEAGIAALLTRLRDDHDQCGNAKGLFPECLECWPRR